MTFPLNKCLSLIVFVLLHGSQTSALENKYRVADISKNLLADSKAVIRNSETVFEILDINRAVKRVTLAITILNTNGIDKSVLNEYYNKFISIRRIQYNLYDKEGIPIKNSTNVEVKDYSANSGYSIYEDNRVKLLDPKYRTTPFTVEYTYEITYSGLFFFPDWHVYEDYNISVEKSKFSVITPREFKFRYLENNITQKCTVTENKDKTNYTWNAENMTALKNEPFSTPIEEYTPVVYTAPSDFEINGFKGSMETWDNFGKWIGLLGKGRNVLDQESTQKIKSLFSGINNDNDRINVLYNYLQNKVRYVSVQVGIGGWQTIDAETVNRLSYGDCKALSNYMKSLLDIAGIKSFYTLVLAGKEAPLIKTDFPSNQFNHVILCVPLTSDTIWLECTSQRIPFGYLGAFTDDRYVLLTNESGGTLVKTKKYSADDNKQIRISVVDLLIGGNASATVRTDYKGILYDDVCGVFQMDETDRKKFVQKRITIPAFSLLGYSHLEEKNKIPVIREDLKLDLPNYGTIIGDKILLNPNLMTRINKLPYRTKDRRSDIFVRRPVSEIDTVTFKIPGNYKIDQLANEVSIKSKFGEYSSSVSINKNGLKYIRKFLLLNGRYTVSDYPDFVDFFERVSAADEHKIALTKII